MAFSIPSKRMFIPGEQLGITDAGIERREKYARFIEHQVKQVLDSEVTQREIKSRVSEKVRLEVDKIVAETAARQVAEFRLSHSISGPPVGEILAAVAKASGFSIAEIHGPHRYKKLSAARHLAVYLMKTLRTDLSLHAIAKAVGRTDHTSGRHGLIKTGRNWNNEPVVTWRAHPALQSLVEAGHD